MDPFPRVLPARRLPLAVCLAVLLALASLCLATSAARAADPVIMAAGDISCASAGSPVPGTCSDLYTSNLALAQQSSPAGLAALLALGDTQYANSTVNEYASGFNLSWGRPALRSVLRPAPGNHEYNTPGAAGYFTYFPSIGVGVGTPGKGWYSFNVGTWHIVSLNSSDGCQPVSCAAGSEQETWLKADLAANASQPCLLAYWHHPLANAPKEAPIWRVLYDAGADFVLAGHVHGFRGPRALDPSGAPDDNGPREMIVGTGGKDGGTYGLLKMTLHPNSADWSFVGTTSASGSATCRGDAPPPPPPPPPPAPKPVSSFSVSTSGLTADFRDTSTGAPTSWTWDFGDGTRVLGGDDPTPNPSHTYAKAGTYTVKLTTANAGGSGTTASRSVVVTSPPVSTPPPPGTPPAAAPPPLVPPAQLVPSPTPAPVAPVPLPPGVTASSAPATLTQTKARAAVRKAIGLRLRGWKFARLSCRKVTTRRASCSFRATRKGRAAAGTGTVSSRATGSALSFSLKVRLSGRHGRTVVWRGSTRP